MRSTLYEGQVVHQRFAPRPHVFRYRLCLLALDLDELPDVFRGQLLWSYERFNVASFRRSDYLGPSEAPLREAVCQRVAKELGRRPQGSLTLVTQVRICGYVFNPVSFYLCRDECGELDCLVAEIQNTPWNERHSYVLDARGGVRTWRFTKEFHISPFLSMNLEYEWHVEECERGLKLQMTVLDRGAALFHAALALQRRPWNGRSLARALLRYPLLPLRLHLAIYWQALRLWLKGTPFFAHPKTVSRIES